jgi:hypothetical protein
MDQEDAGIVSFEAPDCGRVFVDQHHIPTDGNLGHFLGAVPHNRVCVAVVYNLKLMTVNMPRVASGIEIVDYDFDTELMF